MFYLRRFRTCTLTCYWICMAFTGYAFVFKDVHCRIRYTILCFMACNYIHLNCLTLNLSIVDGIRLLLHWLSIPSKVCLCPFINSTTLWLWLLEMSTWKFVFSVLLPHCHYVKLQNELNFSMHLVDNYVTCDLTALDSNEILDFHGRLLPLYPHYQASIDGRHRCIALPLA